MSTNDDDHAGGSARADRLRRQRIAQKHARAAKDGLHLPSVRELISGCPFLFEGMERDVQSWSQRVTPRIDRTTLPGATAATSLEALTVSPTLADFEAALGAIRQGMNHPS